MVSLVNECCSTMSILGRLTKKTLSNWLSVAIAVQGLLAIITAVFQDWLAESLVGTACLHALVEKGTSPTPCLLSQSQLITSVDKNKDGTVIMLAF